MKFRSAVLAGIAACAPEPELASVDQGVGCDPVFCGHNSPTIGTYQMFAFNIEGVANDAGFSIWGLTQQGIAYDLVVKDSRIVGYSGGTPALLGSKLVGAKIWLDYGGAQYAIVITSVGKAYEVVGAPPLPLETYHLEWGQVIGKGLARPLHSGDRLDEPALSGHVPVCPAPPDCSAPYQRADGEWGTRADWDESCQIDPVASLVFEGDIINATARTVSPIADDSWFNVTCGAHLLTKLRLTRNTIHTVKDWRFEQAVMKMLSAQYCGGTAFTVDGEPLVWRDLTGMSFYTSPGTLEARWDENGALCLGEPRLYSTPNPAWPRVLAQIANECPSLRSCTVSDPQKREFANEYATSANY